MKKTMSRWSFRSHGPISLQLNERKVSFYTYVTLLHIAELSEIPTCKSVILQPYNLCKCIDNRTPKAMQEQHDNFGVLLENLSADGSTR
jgi:hypothetical protein